MRLSLLALAIVMACPVASSSSDLTTPAAVVIAKDGRSTDDCVRVETLCAFDAYTGLNNPGEAWIDAYQRVEYVGVAPNVELGPSESARVDASSTSIPNPIIPAATAAWGQASPNAPARDIAGLNLTEQRAGVYYEGPALYDPTGDSGHREFHQDYDDRNGLGYDKQGPYNAPQGADTDFYLSSMSGVVCLFDGDDPACYAAYNSATGEYNRTTPNVRLGLEWYSVQVATSPSALDQPPRNDSAEGGLGKLSPMDEPGALGEPYEESTPEEDVPKQANEWQPSGAPTTAPGEPRRLGPASIAGPVDPTPSRLPLIVAAGIVAVIGWAFVAFYSRLAKRSEVLQNDKRKQLIGVVTCAPGIAVSDLARRLGVSRSTVKHHLKHLARLDIVKTRREGNALAVYPWAVHPSDIPPEIVRVSTREVILRAVQASPQGLSVAELARSHPEVPERTRNHTIARLVSMGWLHTENDRGQRILRPTQNLAVAFAAVKVPPVGNP